jgi:hypothetical protein
VTLFVVQESQKAAQVAVPPFARLERSGDLAEQGSKNEGELIAANQKDNHEPQSVSSSLRAGG